MIKIRFFAQSWDGGRTEIILERERDGSSAVARVTLIMLYRGIGVTAVLLSRLCDANVSVKCSRNGLEAQDI